MTFSQALLERAQPMMNAIMVHPFVQAIAAGTVPNDVLNYYVEQDEHYLKDYLQVTALTITKTDNVDDINQLLTTAQFVQNESRAHQVMLEITGHTIENWRREPEKKRYTDHSMHRLTMVLTLMPWQPFSLARGVMQSLVSNSLTKVPITPTTHLKSGSNYMHRRWHQIHRITTLGVLKR